MPTRTQRGGFEVLTGTFARVAWWVPFALALVAGVAVPAFARVVAHGLLFESFLPVAGPFTAVVLVATGLAAQVEKLRRRRLVEQARTLEGLRALTWRGFEEACAEAFRRSGYDVAETARGADGGVDLILRRDGETTFVQCKHYRRRQVNVHAVRELYGVMASEGAHAGIVVTTGSFTRPAREFAAGKRLELIDGADVLALMKGVDPHALEIAMPEATDEPFHVTPFAPAPEAQLPPEPEPEPEPELAPAPEPEPEPMVNNAPEPAPEPEPEPVVNNAPEPEPEPEPQPEPEPVVDDATEPVPVEAPLVARAFPYVASVEILPSNVRHGRLRLRPSRTRGDRERSRADVGA